VNGTVDTLTPADAQRSGTFSQALYAATALLALMACGGSSAITPDQIATLVAPI
jgi:hypothetical protein